MSEEPRPSLLAQAWVQCLAVALLSVVSFGANLDGMLVWDDPLVIGPAAALRSPLDAFRTDLFATGGAAGAVYYRPLVTASYWVDVHLFTTAPHVGMHLVNLVWHAVASVLVLRALRRWIGATDGEDAGGMIRAAAAFTGAALWAVLPMKAENVAWISGRGDVLGLVAGLAGLEIAARASTAARRAAAVAIGTAVAVLCKESMVALPALVAAAVLAEAVVTGAPSGLRAHVLAALRDPRSVGSAAVVAIYLAARAALLPIASGGQGMFAAVPRVDLVGLFLETTGTAVLSLATPWRAELLRAPIAFRGPGDLVSVPWLATLGAAAWLGGAWLLARRPAARAPVLLAMGTFLPVSNLVPMGLEARGADRFLYVPSLGLALGVAIALAAWVPARRVALATGAGVAAAALLALAASRRAALFASNDTLFTWEVENGDGALAVHSNAAAAALEARRFRDARDRRLAELRRFHELGFRGEGFPQLYEAIRMQVLATGESHPRSLVALEVLSLLLLEGKATTLDVELEGGVLSVDTGSEAARAFVAEWPDRVAVTLGWIQARRGEAEAGVALAERAVAQCTRCVPTRISAAEVALAALDPDRAARWLEEVPVWEPRRAELEDAAAVQRRLLASTPPARAAALFVGGAYGPACEDRTGPPLPELGRGLGARRPLAVACILAGRAVDAEPALGSPVTEPMVREAQAYRWSIADRVAIVRLDLGLGDG